LEGSDRLLGSFGKKQSEYAFKRLEELGVEILTGTMVEDVTKGCVHLADGSTVEAAAIIWAAGTEANPLTSQLGVPLADQAGRVTPEEDLSVRGFPEIFVGGDLACLTDSQDKPVPGVAPAATQMGRHVAKVLKEENRLEKTRFRGQKLKLRPRFRYFDKGIMAIVGKNAAVVLSGKWALTGFIAWLAWLFIHILFLVGFRNKLSVLLGWAFAYVRDAPDTRIIVNRPD
jgi:NADH dehydrogenase